MRTDRPTTKQPWPRIRTAALSPSAFAQAAALLQVAHQHVGIAKVVADIPDRDVAAHAARSMDHLPHGRFGH